MRKSRSLEACGAARCSPRDGIDHDRARELLKHGVGQISRHAGLMPPAQSARTMNAIQGILIEETRLSIPAIFHEESCAGFLAQDASCFPMPLALASTFAPELAEENGRRHSPPDAGGRRAAHARAGG